MKANNILTRHRNKIMKTSITAIAIILAIATGTHAAMPAADGQPAAARQTTYPDGTNKIKNITVSRFDKIENSGTCRVIYTQKSGAPTVTVSAPAGLIDRPDISVKSGTLYIDYYETSSRDNGDNQITVRVSSPSLTAVTLESASAMTIKGTLTTPSFFLDMSGASYFRADAINCKDMTADIDGASSVKINKVSASTYHFDASGASKASLHLSASTATFDISGASHIKLSGTVSRAEYIASGISRIDAAALKTNHAKAQASGMSRVECNAVVHFDSEQSEMAEITNKGNASPVGQNGSEATQEPGTPQPDGDEDAASTAYSQQPDNDAMPARQTPGDTGIGDISLYGICIIAALAVVIGISRKSRKKRDTQPAAKPESDAREAQGATATAEEAESPAASGEDSMPSLASLPVMQKITCIINDKTDNAGHTTQEKLTADDWAALDKGVNMIYPGFKQRLLTKKLSEQEYRICLLTKAGVSPTGIARLTHKDRAAISNARSRLYKKFFDQKGNCEAWDEFIRSL